MNWSSQWTAADREAARRQNVARERKRTAERTAAATLATRIWAATSPARTHPYCDKKGITPPACLRSIARLELAAIAPDLYVPGQGDLLVVPVSQWANGKAALTPRWSSSTARRANTSSTADRRAPASARSAMTRLQTSSRSRRASRRRRACTRRRAGSTVTAFYAANLQPVAEAFHARFPAATIVIAADRDASGEGETCGQAAADAVGGLLAVSPVVSDWNDLQAAEGVDAVAAGLEAQVDRATATRTPADLLGLP